VIFWTVADAGSTEQQIILPDYHMKISSMISATGDADGFFYIDSTRPLSGEILLKQSFGTRLDPLPLSQRYSLRQLGQTSGRVAPVRDGIYPTSLIHNEIIIIYCTLDSVSHFCVVISAL
jgi:hypothetical protein